PPSELSPLSPTRRSSDLTALGALEPLGPLTILAPMGVAIGKAHAGKPIWATEGGAELPVTNAAIALALVLLGPGRFSLDRLLRIDRKSTRLNSSHVSISY